jgi:aldehyde dehydrogenase
MAVDETGMGRVDDKLAKNLSQARLTPGVECLQARALTGDHGMTQIENAAWGVISSVTPSTNPAATIINNAISMVAAGNSVVFAPHPSAQKVSHRTISILNDAIESAGGPRNLLTATVEASIAGTQRLFKHSGVDLLTVTGGGAVMHEARKHTNKRLIGAGAGNPPVVVDETADVGRAARDIVWGASFDNNIICVDEKAAIVVELVWEQLRSEMQKHKAVELTAAQARALQDVLLSEIDATGLGRISRQWVGKDACKIAAAIGLSVPEDTRLLFCAAERNHPFAVTELMMPVLPVIRAPNADTAIDIAIELEGGLRHTAAMHSRNLDNLDRMANEINTSIFVKNGPCLAGLGFGGEGSTTMTISTPTGEGVTTAETFVRLRRCVLVDNFRII